MGESARRRGDRQPVGVRLDSSQVDKLAAEASQEPFYQVGKGQLVREAAVEMKQRLSRREDNSRRQGVVEWLPVFGGLDLGYSCIFSWGAEQGLDCCQDHWISAVGWCGWVY